MYSTREHLPSRPVDDVRSAERCRPYYDNMSRARISEIAPSRRRVDGFQRQGRVEYEPSDPHIRNSVSAFGLVVKTTVDGNAATTRLTNPKRGEPLAHLRSSGAIHIISNGLVEILATGNREPACSIEGHGLAISSVHEALIRPQTILRDVTRFASPSVEESPANYAILDDVGSDRYDSLGDGTGSCRGLPIGIEIVDVTQEHSANVGEILPFEPGAWPGDAEKSVDRSEDRTERRVQDRNPNRLTRHWISHPVVIMAPRRRSRTTALQQDRLQRIFAVPSKINGRH